MYKKVIGLVLVGMMSLSVVGCGNKSNEQVSENKTEIVVENQDAEKFKERDILSYTVETNRDDDHFVVKVKITNNGDKPINNYWLGFSIYDGNGDKLNDEWVCDEAVLQPGKSNTEEMYIYELETKEIQLTEYHYDVPNEKVVVFINTELETVDINEME